MSAHTNHSGVLTPGVSLVNPGASLFDVEQVKPGKVEEEEEAEHEQLGKERELQELLANAFDDLIEEEDEEVASASAVGLSRISQQDVNRWEEEFDRPSHTEERNLIQSPSEQYISEHGSYYDSHDERNGGVSADFQSHTGSDRTDISRSPDDLFRVTTEQSSPQPSISYASAEDVPQADQPYVYQKTEEHSPYSRTGDHQWSKPESQEGVGHADTGQHIHSEQYRVTYQRLPAYADEHAHRVEPVQQQFLDAGGGGDGSEVAQLRILYGARGRRIDELTRQYESLQEESAREVRLLRHKLTMAEDEREGMAESLRNTQQLLQGAGDESNKQHGHIAALESELQNFQSLKQELLEKLQITENTVDSLELQLEELSQSESVARARQQHDQLMDTVTRRHERDMLDVREKLDLLYQQLQLRDEETDRLKGQLGETSKALDQAQLDKAETINRLHRSLEESQRQYKELLDNSDVHEVTRVKQQLQQTLSAKDVAEEALSAVQAEVQELKSQVNVYESAAKLGVYPKGRNMPDSVKKTLDYTTPHAAREGNGSRTDTSDGQLVSELRQQLERSITVSGGNRTQLSQLRHELRACKQQLQEALTNAKASDSKISEAKDENKTLRDELDDMRLDRGTKAERALRKEVAQLKEHGEELVDKLKAAQARVEELCDTEDKMKAVNADVNRQLSYLIDERDIDVNAAVDRARKALQLVHDETKRKLEEELTSRFSTEIQQLIKDRDQQIEALSSDLKSLEANVTDVKKCYVEVCEEKEKLQRHFDQLTQKHRSIDVTKDEDVTKDGTMTKEDEQRTGDSETEKETTSKSDTTPEGTTSKQMQEQYTNQIKALQDELDSTHDKCTEFQLDLDKQTKLWQEEREALLDTKCKEKQTEICTLKEAWRAERSTLLQQVEEKEQKMQEQLLQVKDLGESSAELQQTCQRLQEKLTKSNAEWEERRSREEQEQRQTHEKEQAQEKLKLQAEFEQQKQALREELEEEITTLQKNSTQATADMLLEREDPAVSKKMLREVERRLSLQYKAILKEAIQKRDSALENTKSALILEWQEEKRSLRQQHEQDLEKTRACYQSLIERLAVKDGRTIATQTDVENVTSAAVAELHKLYMETLIKMKGDFVRYFGAAKDRAVQALLAERYSTATLLKTYYQRSVSTDSETKSADARPTSRKLTFDRCIGKKRGHASTLPPPATRNEEIWKLRSDETNQTKASTKRATSRHGRRQSSPEGAADGAVGKACSDGSRHSVVRGQMLTPPVQDTLACCADGIKMLPVNINKLRSASAEHLTNSQNLPDRPPTEKQNGSRKNSGGNGASAQTVASPSGRKYNSQSSLEVVSTQPGSTSQKDGSKPHMTRPASEDYGLYAHIPRPKFVSIAQSDAAMRCSPSKNLLVSNSEAECVSGRSVQLKALDLSNK
ncbi:PREDICTED: centrosomal protein of 152 kDa-like isoform X2 [Priapulus caudatus]|uniref:Centrosomal protein of 152 kDa-like isoform X2 n=1 Tax=Priapulus caudatus TaxID=37621 RepID=A0ABM1DXW9_PRICU|nr:PREDICTED: centrosomal protein of 152 kDa-like isoform X2 [Priapulus caudatus]